MIVYVYMQPVHNKKVFYIDIIFLSILFAEYFHLLVASFEHASSNSESISLSYLVTVLLFFVSLIVPAFAHVIAINRQQTLQNNLLMAQG